MKTAFGDAVSEAFASKLDLALRALSSSRGQLAKDLGVHKSLVSRWCSGETRPSPHNLARLTALVARSRPRFCSLDWERPLSGFAEALGIDPALVETAVEPEPRALPLPLIADALAMTRQWGAAYEGLWRTLRPFAQKPGRFIRDHMMVRLDPLGLLRFDLVSLGTTVEGWILPLKNQLFIIGAEMASRSFVFGVFNGVNTGRAEVIDGLVTLSTLDVSRTPVSTAMLLERVGDLTGGVQADRARFALLAGDGGIVEPNALDPAVTAHLAREVGPAQLPRGGDWVLSSPLARSLARGSLPPEADPRNIAQPPAFRRNFPNRAP